MTEEAKTAIKWIKELADYVVDNYNVRIERFGSLYAAGAAETVEAIERNISAVRYNTGWVVKCIEKIVSENKALKAEIEKHKGAKNGKAK